MSNIKLDELLISLSRALDLLSPKVSEHHHRVTLIAMRLGEGLGLSEEDRVKLFRTALFHDIGVVTSKDKLMIMDFFYTASSAHTAYGRTLLNESSFFTDISDLVFHHHDRWLGPNKSEVIKDDIPLISQIVGLADRIEVLLTSDKYILIQQEPILKKISEFTGTWFNPKLIEQLKKASRPEYFWLDLSDRFLHEKVEALAPGKEVYLSLDDVLSIVQIFTLLVDNKSRFMKTHSQSVHELTMKLATARNFNDEDLKKIKIASLMHDLGKLSIPDDILEKPSVLTKEEYNIIKRHPYYTCQIIRSVKGLEEISHWASTHHERLNGSGYPFKLKGDDVPLAARIIAVADVFTALHEDRPYRKKLPKEQAIRLLEQQAKQELLDGEIVETLKKVIVDQK